MKENQALNEKKKPIIKKTMKLWEDFVKVNEEKPSELCDMPPVETYYWFWMMGRNFGKENRECPTCHKKMKYNQRCFQHEGGWLHD